MSNGQLTTCDAVQLQRSQLGQACGLLQLALARAADGACNDATAGQVVENNVRQLRRNCAAIKRTCSGRVWNATTRSDAAGLFRTMLDAHDLAAMASLVPTMATAGNSYAAVPQQLFIHYDVSRITADLHHLILDPDEERSSRIRTAAYWTGVELIRVRSAKGEAKGMNAHLARSYQRYLGRTVAIARRNMR